MTKWQGKPKRPRTHTKSDRLLKSAESGRNGRPQGWAHQLLIQYRMVSPEHIHTRTIIQPEDLGICVHPYTYMHGITMQKRPWLKENRRVIWEGLEIGKGSCIYVVIIISKIKKQKKKVYIVLVIQQLNIFVVQNTWCLWHIFPGD